MPQLQWLGTMPEEKQYLAEALKGGVEAYIGAKEKREERELDLTKISFTKKQKAADMVMKQTEYATPQQKKKIVESDAGELVRDVYGDEGYNTWAGVGSSKGKAGDIAEIRTWIAMKGKPSKWDKYGGIGISKKKNMDREITFKLDDPNWRTNYPNIAAELDAAYKEKPEAKKEGFKFPWQQKSKYSEEDIAHTMKVHNLSREEVLKRLGAQ